MPQQRMAGYTPFQGTLWPPQVSGREAPLPTAAAPAPVDVAAPEVAAVAAPEVGGSTAAPPAAPVTGVPYERRQRMAGYTPFRGEASAASRSAPAAAPAAPVATVGVVDAGAAGAATAAPVAALAGAEPAAASSAAPAAATVVPAKVGQRMKGYTPLKSAAPVPAAPVTTATPATPATPAAPTEPAVSPVAPSVQPAEVAAAAPAASAAPAPDTRSAPPASSVPPPPAAAPAAARGTRAATPRAAEAEPSRWRRLLWPVLGAVLTGLVLVLAARGLRTLDPVADFIAAYPGSPALPEGTPVGKPAWMGWQHFLNMFLMVLIIRTGLQIRAEQRPPATFTPREGGPFLARGNTPKKYSLTIWTHMALDALWLLNGLVFVVLLFATGQWAHIVPTDPHVFQHAASTALQYASLDWPQENGWVHYNALQMIAYGLVVFVAAPLSALTGWRMSSWFPTGSGLAKAFPMEAARRVHFPVMVFFVLFIVVHVFLVFFTGALRNLNHMYTSRDVVDGWGLAVFLLSLAVTAAAWFFLKPAFTAPVAERFGTVGR